MPDTLAGCTALVTGAAKRVSKQALATRIKMTALEFAPAIRVNGIAQT
jgi:hypothetical protein